MPRANPPDEDIIAVNMSSSWDWKTNISIAATPKSVNPQTGTAPPSLVAGALFPGVGETKIYTFGGRTSMVNESFQGYMPPDSDQYSLWSYDTTTSVWQQYDLFSQGIIRPTNGATASAPEQGLGFFYNGYINSGSSTSTRAFGSSVVGLKGMVVIDVKQHTARNLSTQAVSDQARTNGRLAYISNISSGVLVLIGGGEKPVTDRSNNTFSTLVSFNLYQ
jgi:hypothetical protein